MGYAEKRAEIQKKLDVAKTAREARDEKELEVIEQYLVDDGYVVVRLPDAAPNFVGHVVCHRPKGPAYERFKQTMWKDSAQRGVTEAKSRAGAELANLCLVYPAQPDYQALIAEYAFVPDKIAEAMINAAQAGADAEGKG